MYQDLGCEERLWEAISLEVGPLELNDKAVLQALDRCRKRLYTQVTREATRRQLQDEHVLLMED